MVKDPNKEWQALVSEIEHRRMPVNQLLPVETFIKAPRIAVEARKLMELEELLWLPEGLEDDDRRVRILRAVELFEELQPQDAAETMLAAQMVGTHTAALECLRRAAVQGQTFEGRDINLKHAEKLMALYTKQLATLDKHRGKGQQKVTVEYVNVESGGQAIVGNVETDKSTSRSKVSTSTSVTQVPTEPLPDIEPAKKKKVRRGQSDP
ncbi:hypothetical protein C7964_10421 [Loktanella sp. PT4BL]|jgi:hypothetical protein|uniref:hypothetical protein n=1 Tax=Loktanella sp. PT4BL TaxID=2135611 RepID=UPI000D754DE4|nr:hypothetical protein [Loktanella sp. PT4BL]PXW67932.1 hypothetical protein C7964_10421 [Loktanella sp. PT4BL]